MSDSFTLPTVGGRRMECSNADFERRCLVAIGVEQEKIAPDNFLIALICDAVRCVREYTDAMQRSNEPHPASPGWSGDDTNTP
jgi:hypothetical protein